MKKIFSLILVSIALVVLASAPALAADASAFDVVVSFNAEKLAVGTEAEMTITFNFDGEYKLAAFEVPFELSNLTLGNIVSMTEGFSTSGMAVNDGKFIWSDANQVNPFTSVSFTYKVTAESAGTASIAIDEFNTFACDDYTVGDIYATETEADASIEVKGAAPSVNTVAAAETIKTDVMTSQEPAGYEKGQGFALRFAAGDVANFTKMIWALTVDGAKKYSDAVAFNAASIADNAQVEVAATFLNQNEAAVSAVNAIFCTEDGTEYFTDAADAGNKKQAE